MICLIMFVLIDDYGKRDKPSKKKSNSSFISLCFVVSIFLMMLEAGGWGSGLSKTLHGIVANDLFIFFFQNAKLNAQRNSHHPWKWSNNLMSWPLDHSFRSKNHRPSDEIKKKSLQARNDPSFSLSNRLKMLKVDLSRFTPSLSFITDRDPLHTEHT